MTMTRTTRRVRGGTPANGSARAVPRFRFAAAMALAAGILAVDVFRGTEGASAADYPSWEDVLAARASESTKQAEVTRIQGLIAGLEAEVVAAQALAVQRADEHSAAQAAYDSAAFRADELAAQAVEAASRAEASNAQAGMLITQFTRAGGADLTLNLIVAGDDSDDLLYQLGAMSQLSQKTGQLYEQAASDRNTAQSLTEQAEVAESALEALKIAAQEAFDAAIAAQEQVEAALAEQQAQGAVLQEQLASLASATQKTVAEYEKGVEERRKAEEAARAAAAAAAAAAREAAGGGDSGPGPSVDGWSSPLSNWIVSDEFGNRFHPIDRVWRLHAGIDLVRGGGTCGAPVYAAAAGTVTQASYNGGLGNSVTISHGGGLTTVYGHNSSLNVGRGQDVGGGEIIAWAGTTGSSTGCHVHFETRVNGSAQNPRNWVSF
ncbi:peptidoglycan DD-metalloendopeptidase family protein [Herbiconiux sp. YIM B11900]|uniref:M23 family metallopeptidase n=1 Tax=Herbiconiux sp. YIM B11900 TaxID=3404131 RepID=UPI003F858292